MPTGYCTETGLNPFKGKKRGPFSDKHKLSISLSGKGRIPWNKGMKGVRRHTEETKKLMSSQRSGEKHWDWRGDNVKYSSLHSWIRKHWGSASRFACEHCGAKKNTQWANIGKNYTKNRSDWLILCSRCHYHYDKCKICKNQNSVLCS